MKKFIGFIGIFLLSMHGWGDVKPFMDQMLHEIFTIKPFIVSESSFKDPKNSEKIEGSLKKMIELSKKINHEDKIKKTGFQVSGKMLTEQLSETELVFQHGNKDYAFWKLKSTLGVCMSCHTQLPAVSTKFTTMNTSNILTNPFEEAEFLFVIRNFDEAMKLYSKALRDYPKNNVTMDSLEKAIYRQMFYYVRVKRDFKSLVKTLGEDKSNTKLPNRLLKNIDGLISAAEKMSSEPYPSFTIQQEAELRKYVETALKEELQGNFNFEKAREALLNLKVSSVLYEFLSQSPKTSLKPDILYWLSFCESYYTHQTFDSLPEMYLKQCVVEFPKQPVAKKCLKEYKDLILMAYTGSGGTNIPDDVNREIRAMEELVNPKGK